MKANICFISNSFDFTISEYELIAKLSTCTQLIKKMDSDFISFYKSNDFDSDAAIKLATRGGSIDIGVIMKSLYDDTMGKVTIINSLGSSDIVSLTDSTPPIYINRWVSLYSSSNTQLTLNPERTIANENDIVKYCSKILVSNQRNHGEYTKALPLIYKNLLFLNHPAHNSFTTFNSIRKISGGYNNFIKGITDSLTYMNAYGIIPNDSKKNIDHLNVNLEFPVTDEGKGKNQRKIKALKRDFFIEGQEYKNINCEYHYKLERVDNSNGKGTYYFNRIYFGFFNRIDPDKPKIAIAHIGEHL